MSRRKFEVKKLTKQSFGLVFCGIRLSLGLNFSHFPSFRIRAHTHTQIAIIHRFFFLVFLVPFFLIFLCGFIISFPTISKRQKKNRLKNTKSVIKHKLCKEKNKHRKQLQNKKKMKQSTAAPPHSVPINYKNNRSD